MNKRQRERLNSLANFIEKNPDKFSMTQGDSCIVGLGNRLRKGKLESTDLSKDTYDFAERFGVTTEEARNIYWGYWSKVNRKTTDARTSNSNDWWLSDGQVAEVPARRAAAFLRQVAKNHA